MSSYRIDVFYSAEDGGYIADVPDLGFCSAFGLTPQEALDEALRAEEAWLSVARERGISLPEPPQYRPALQA